MKKRRVTKERPQQLQIPIASLGDRMFSKRHPLSICSRLLSSRGASLFETSAIVGVMALVTVGALHSTGIATSSAFEQACTGLEGQCTEDQPETAEFNSNGDPSDSFGDNQYAGGRSLDGTPGSGTQTCLSCDGLNEMGGSDTPSIADAPAESASGESGGYIFSQR